MMINLRFDKTSHNIGLSRVSDLAFLFLLYLGTNMKLVFSFSDVHSIAITV